MIEEIKAVGIDMKPLNEVKIFNAKGELIRVVQAKRIEPDINQFQQTKRSNKIKKEIKDAGKKLKASDLIEI